MSAAAISCSLVVPTRSRPEELRRCLSAVAALSPRPDEIIVVDNSGGDPSTRSVAHDFSAIYVLEPVTGASRARNAGCRSAHSDVIAFLDDDLVPRDGWLPALLDPFADGSVVATTGRVLPLITTDARSLDLGHERQVFDQTSPRWFEMANFGGVGFGGIMAIRRAAFQSWPGFHPMIGRGTAVPAGEDNYAFYELIKLGGRIAYCPDAVAFNAEPPARAATRVDPVARVSAAAAHATLLVAEAPGSRWRTMRFAVRGLFGRNRAWRAAADTSPALEPTNWQLGWGVARGVSLYVQSRVRAACDPARRWQRGRIDRPSEPTADSTDAGSSHS